MSLVSIDQAKAHLRIDTDSLIPSDAADADLLLKIDAAEGIILDYLKIPVTSPEYWDSSTVPPMVQAAILLQLGELYRFRGDDVEHGPQTTGDLSPIVTNILRRYRDPALA